MNDENIGFVNNNLSVAKNRVERNIYVSSIAVLFFAIAVISIIQSKLEKGIIVNGRKIVDEKSSENQNCIYITGEVKKEGVVCVDKNDSISKAISEAGGVNKNADMEGIDESRNVVDGEKIFIASRSDEKESIVVPNKNDNTNDKYTSNGGNVIKVNINTATEEELDTLEGIGPSTAKKIIEYRKNNIFQNVEELKNVSGIGDAKYIKIAENICVE